MSTPKTYLIIGASRGIGLEFTRQLLATNQRVIATAREATGASQLWALTGTANGSNLSILECDVADERSVRRFVEGLGVEMDKGGKLGALKRPEESRVIDVCVVNAGVLVYPNRVMEITYKEFSHHLTTNTIGPLLVAAAILKLSPPILVRTLVFMSSDSGSAARFRSFEDGFAAYAASKAALNQGLRHLAAELPRLPAPASPLFPVPTAPSPHPNSQAVVLALHPGEVATDMAAAALGDLAWEVEGIITPEESVRGMLRVVAEKGWGGSAERGGEALGVATFWDWEGRAYPW